MFGYEFTSEELSKIADAQPGQFMNTLGGIGKAVGGAAALALAGSAADSIIQNTKFYLGRAVARQRMNKHLDVMGPGIRENVLGPYGEATVNARFDSLYRLAPSLMEDPTTAIGLVSDSLRVDETALSPATAQELVSMEGTMSRATHYPGAASQIMSGIGQQMAGKMIDKTINPSNKMQELQAQHDLNIRKVEREYELRRELDEEKRKSEIQQRQHDNEENFDRQLIRDLANVLMKQELEHSDKGTYPLTFGHAAGTQAHAEKVVKQRREQQRKTAAIEYTTHVVQQHPTEERHTSPVTLGQLDLLMKVAAVETGLQKEADWVQGAKGLAKAVGGGALGGAAAGGLGAWSTDLDPVRGAIGGAIGGAGAGALGHAIFGPAYGPNAVGALGGGLFGAAAGFPAGLIGGSTGKSEQQVLDYVREHDPELYAQYEQEKQAQQKEAEAWSHVGRSALKGLGFGAGGGALLGAGGGIIRGEGVGDTLKSTAVGAIGGGLLGAAGGAGHRALVGKGGPNLWGRMKDALKNPPASPASVASTAAPAAAPVAPPAPAPTV